MKKKIAVPLEENGKLSGHFGHSTLFEIFDVEENKVISSQKLTPPPHTPGAIPKWLVENKVTDVITGGIGEKATKILEHFSINIHKGAPVLLSGELVEALLNNSLELNAENCNHHHHEHHHEHHHGHHHDHSDQNHEFDNLKLHLHHRHHHGENE